MTRLLSLLVLAATLTGCELFVIGGGGPKVPVIERNQQSSLGVVYLWKAELDSSNLTAVTELMRHPTGRQFLALERYELADDLDRWRVIMGGKPITSTAVDTLSTNSHTVRAKVDYIRDVTFQTIRQDDEWFVTSVR